MDHEAIPLNLKVDRCADDVFKAQIGKWGTSEILLVQSGGPKYRNYTRCRPQKHVKKDEFQKSDPIYTFGV